MISLIKSTFYKEADTKRKLCEFILSADKLSIGEQCQTFEENFARWQGRKHCVMFNSGSSANLALIQALLNDGIIAPNSAVGFSAITWATNVMPLLQLSLRPVPVDVGLNTLNISVETLTEAYEREPFSCLFLTNLLGLSDDIEGVRTFCNAHNIVLIEDNCESLGSEFEHTKLGNFGIASTFSFFVGHHLSTIEGGAVCTDDPELATSLRMIRSHGWDRHLDSETQIRIREKHGIKEFYAKYTFYSLAYNLRPTELQGFLGTNQLQYLDEMVAKREKNYDQLSVVYQHNPNLIPIQDMMSTHSNFAFPLVCKNVEAKERLLEKCAIADIETRPMVGGLMTKQPFYARHVENLPLSLPNAELLHTNSFYVGNNPELTPEELAIMIATLS